MEAAIPKLAMPNVDTVKPGKGHAVLWDEELPRWGLRVKLGKAMTYVVHYRNSAGRTPKLAMGSFTPGAVSSEAAYAGSSPWQRGSITRRRV